ncbi:MAG: GNAT family N-acetyltransferase [Verrucomicrobiota bacterium]
MSALRSVLETRRTMMRPFQISDAEESYSWLGDPEVMRYIPFGADSCVADTVERIDRYIQHQNRHGFSKWVIADRDSQKLIGDAGLFHLPDGRRIELGYRLASSYWGQGLATEVARSWIEVANEFVKDSTLYAFAHPENAASLHLLRKLGFHFLGNETFYEIEAPLFELDLETLGWI